MRVLLEVKIHERRQEDDEKEEALEGDPVSVEGKVTLIIRSSSDEKKREAIRILRVS